MKKLIGGMVLLFLGLFMLVENLERLLLFYRVSQMDQPSGLGGYPLYILTDAVLFPLLLGVIGGLLIRSHVKHKRRLTQEQRIAAQTSREKAVIRLARQQGGRITIPDIVAETSLNTTEAEALMRDLTVKGHVGMHVTEAGAIVYEFFDTIRPQEEK
ncbi:hypothetical protein GF339_13525 [candidate division KSB3 bacterium]|uniref:Uncharacterized protein n=1 Tax=candidate division KSB3 bacterium TaxID=2044937 RepID=A0A9D5JWJ7_9BACT|nr:hypothetical protein [candidate division KSB3 bacterium]MBD3325599.1 hypothetical protein [candidate division KSB3 bacterium]